MERFRDYLREKAKFYSPPTAESSTSSTDLNDVEVDQLDDRWRPVVAFHDNRMVDTLLETLDEILGDRPLPVEQHMLDKLFEPMIDSDRNNRKKRSWKTNKDEFEAREMVDTGALDALSSIMEDLDCPVTSLHNTSPAGPEFASLVDYAIFANDGEGKRVLLEIKSPSVLEHSLPKLQRRGFNIYLRSGRPSVERVINKACLYMSSHKAHWLALTSHNKWVFFRLHPDRDRPYITYSNVLKQHNNTRPFRAFLAMVLATALGRNVQSHADTAAPLPPIGEDDEDDDDGYNDNDNDERDDGDNDDEYDPHEHEDESGHSSEGMRDEPPVTRRGPRGTRASDLLISWSRHKASHPRLFPFYLMGRTNHCLPLDTGTAHLWLQRKLGKGATSVVYEAISDDVGPDKAYNLHSYAVKIVITGATEVKRGYIACLHKEFEAYRKIEQAKRNGEMKESVTPNCYGLYKSKRMMALILDCGGEALTDEEWRSLSSSDRSQIFDLISAIHKAGIAHCDLEPRNVVRTTIGSYQIIDFSLASFHKCPGIKEVNWYTEGRECAELKHSWKQLVEHRVKKHSLNGVASTRAY